MGDPLILGFLKESKETIARLAHDLAEANIRDMYQLGRMQGTIDGHKASLEILNKVMSDSRDEE